MCPLDSRSHQLGARLEQLDPERGGERDQVTEGLEVERRGFHGGGSSHVAAERVCAEWSAMSVEGLHVAEEKLRAAGQPDEAVLAFGRAYQRVDAGESAVMRSEDLEPASSIPSFDELPD